MLNKIIWLVLLAAGIVLLVSVFFYSAAVSSDNIFAGSFHSSVYVIICILSAVVVCSSVFLYADHIRSVRIPLKRLYRYQQNLIENNLKSFSLALSEFSMGNLIVSVRETPAENTFCVGNGIIDSLYSQFHVFDNRVRENISELNNMTYLSCRRLLYVGADSYLEGMRCGEIMEQLTGGKGQVAVLMKSLKNTSHALRRKGFINYLFERCDDITVVETCEEQEDADLAYSLTAALLEKYPHLSGIYITEGASPSAVAKAVEDNGKKDKVRIVGHDVTPDTMEYIKKGVITATLYQKPYSQGYEPVIRLANYLISRDVLFIDRFLTRLEVVKQENLRDYWDDEKKQLRLDQEKTGHIGLLKNEKNKPVRIGVILPAETAFWEPVSQGVRDAQREVKNAGGDVAVVISDPGAYMDTAYYIEIINKFIHDNYNAIVLPVFDKALVPYLNDAADKGTLFAIYNAEPVSFRGMIESVSDKIKHLFALSENLASSTTEAGQATSQISETMQLILSSIKEQLDQFSNANDTIGKLLDNVSNISSLSSRSAQVAGETNRNARIGNELVRAIHVAMDEFSKMTNAATDIVKELNTNAGKISKIIVMIEDISSSTNFIAINASILAARLGSEGNSFSIVAEEIKKLAGQSRESTVHISHLVETILENVRVVTETIIKEQEEILKAGARTEKAEKALSDIIEASARNVENVDSINTIANDMRDLSEKVSKAMGALVGINNKNSDAIEQITSSISELNIHVAGNSSAAHTLSGLAQAQEDIFIQFFPGTKKGK